MTLDGPDAGLERVLATYRFGSRPIYVVGSFDVGVTVLSQQVRALNLAWAMTSTEPSLAALTPRGTGAATKRKKVAIVGGGFAGLSVAAGLMRREFDAEITLFEQRDTLLPLQQGSDARWLHPRIYDWPDEGSEAGAAMLPVLNWTAGRASDVVVQVLTAWRAVVEEARAGGGRPLQLFCNARHIQIFEPRDPKIDGIGIEWVGEPRDARDATSLDHRAACGSTDIFDVVILTVGFGLERDEVTSYWRNDVTSQPSLDRSRRTYLVSGQGDGAMIDLLRLRVSHYRQDRILGELLDGFPHLVRRLKDIHERDRKGVGGGLFDAFERIAEEDTLKSDLDRVRGRLTRRLRRDTDAVLHLKLRRFYELFDPLNTRISFQNRFLVYLLYKCGGFVPSFFSEEDVVRHHSIERRDVIRRHGTFRDEQFRAILSDRLYDELSTRRGSAVPDPMSQIDEPCWPGGYFALGSARGNSAKGYWRKEYLPAPTALLALSFCSAVAGRLAGQHGHEGRLRVTLHRAMTVGGQELLQQCCEYVGINLEPDTRSSARTFPARNATIGVAYRTRAIVRSREAAGAAALRSTMEHLQLSDASRDMNRDVDFLLAIPILEPEGDGKFTRPSPVAGVLYVDSTRPGYHLGDEALHELVDMCRYLISSLEGAAKIDGIANVRSSGMGGIAPDAEGLDAESLATLEIVNGIDPPRCSDAFQLNFDFADFVSVDC